MRCPQCGTDSRGDYRFCPRCGYAFDQMAAMPPRGYMQPQPRRSESNTALTIIIVIVVVVAALIAIPAVLYVMTSDFEGTPTQTPAALFAKTTVEGGVKITIVSITYTKVVWDDISVLLGDGTSYAEWDPETADLDGGSVATASYPAEPLGALSVTMTVTDLAGNGVVSSGDYFTLIANPVFLSGTTYTALFLWDPTSEQMGTGMAFTG